MKKEKKKATELTCADEPLCVRAARQEEKERRCEVSAQHHRLVCLCDRCTIARWEWPRSSRGAELQTVVTSATPRLSYCGVTPNWHLTVFHSKCVWINEALIGLGMRLLNRTCDLCSLSWVLHLILITQSVSFDHSQQLFLMLHSATLMIFALVQTAGAGVKLCTSLWHINNWTGFLGRAAFKRWEFCFVSSFQHWIYFMLQGYWSLWLAWRDKREVVWLFTKPSPSDKNKSVN